MRHIFAIMIAALFLFYILYPHVSNNIRYQNVGQGKFHIPVKSDYEKVKIDSRGGV